MDGRLALIAFATLVFGVSTFLRKVSLTYVGPLQFQAIASLVYGAMAVPLVYVLLKTPELHSGIVSRSGIFWCVLATIVHVFGAYAFMVALQKGNDVGLVSALISTSPVITLVLSMALLNEQLSLRQGVGIACAIGGMVVAAWK